MSVINTRPLAGASGNQATGYNLTNSLRFRSSASAYLTRTYGTPTNSKIYTFSFWVKRGKLGANQEILNGNSSSSQFYFQSNDTLNFYDGTSGAEYITTQVFRDPSAWYHIVVAMDTTQATSGNRTKIYVNGSQVTSFGTATAATQNANSAFNVASTLFALGVYYPTPSNYFDGYLTETIFVDGQQLSPSSFGETDTITGVWKPKRYTGTYGTNGFYLPFTDVATTSGSNAGLGKDFSGNSNYWNTNNISVTTGSTYDSMTDVPTLTSATAANYCVLNPLQTPAAVKFANLGFAGSGDDWYPIAGTIGVSSGKWYWEVVFNANFTFGMTGIAPTTYVPAKGTFPGSTATSYGYWSNNGNKYNNGASTSYGASYTGGDVIGVALDMDAGTLTFYKNNTSQGTAYSSLTGTFVPAIASYVDCTANFGQQGFAYTPPTGFKALNTYNLPDSTIVAGNKVMDATTFTANGGAQTVINAGGFKPDLIWNKARSTTSNHWLANSIAGPSYYLRSNLTDAEVNDATLYTSFNSNGYSLGSGNMANGTTMVGWQWQAGQGVTSSNTSGSITSTVSVNASAGFSIVTYTGNGSATATIGHGLGVAPQFIITKDRSAISSWIVQHNSLGWTQGFLGISTVAATTSSAFSNNTAPSNTVFTIAAYSNNNSDNYVAYCWAAVPGFSAFGSYTGNGSSDGTFVYTGFRPKFIMYKNSATGNYWRIMDTSVNTYNVTSYGLYPNDSAAEGTATNWYVDYLSNGFKIRASTSELNGSGNSIIYAAFAENPFKNSLAR